MIRKYILFAILVVLLVVVIIWIIWGNVALEIKTIKVSSKKIPQSFDGFRIAHISDLHNAEFGKGNAKLISKLKEAEADIIVITGDIVDSRRTDIEKALHFAGDAANLAPVYYVNGNHESRLDTADVSRGDEEITLIGINDPRFGMKLVDDDMEQNIKHQIMSVVPLNDNYKVLLAHRPEHFDFYADKVDLVFTGHAHGGQFIIPFVGGILAPGQGLLPKYYDGLYEKGATDMIVSRGIGNSIFPFRINNRPVVVAVELEVLENE